MIDYVLCNCGSRMFPSYPNPNCTINYVDGGVDQVVHYACGHCQNGVRLVEPAQGGHVLPFVQAFPRKA